MTLGPEPLGANVALKLFDSSVNCFQVKIHVGDISKSLATDIALVFFDVFMNSFYMSPNT